MKQFSFSVLALCVLFFSSCTQETITTTTNSGDTLNGLDTTQFYINSSAIIGNELLAAFKCETKSNDIESSIPLEWGNVPSTATTLVIMMYHFPNPNDQSQANSYLHLWNIDPTVTAMPYGTADDGPWYIGSNKDGTAISYTSPCSPSAGSHEYKITIYDARTTVSSLLRDILKNVNIPPN
ncbi:MAG: hypothetical protein JKY03_15190, partial [Aureispira sp.]|nr:hypothetical protein [Aureispira sp.]